MLTAAYVIDFVTMILVPVLAWIFFVRKFKLSWKLVLAGGFTFIASQIPHIPLTVALTPFFKSWGPAAYAVTLGLLAGLFEETARYILFRFILKRSRTWNEGLLVGLGHGGTEAVLLGCLAAVAFVNMLAYRNLDLSTVPGIPASQLALAKQQVAAYWSAPVYMALLGAVERVFAICLHLALSVMVLYGLAVQKPIWYWLAVLWHALVDGLAVFLALQGLGALGIEGVIGLLAVLSIGILWYLRGRFPQTKTDPLGPASPAQQFPT